jgi:hypothetical protein
VLGTVELALLDPQLRGELRLVASDVGDEALGGLPGEQHVERLAERVPEG